MPRSDRLWRSALSVTQASVTRVNKVAEIAGVAHGTLDALVGHHPGDDQDIDDQQRRMGRIDRHLAAQRVHRRTICA
jgi:hypothetical protein